MIFDDLATRLAGEYQLLLLALTGRYQQVRAPGVEVTPRAVADLSHDAHQLAQTFYVIAETTIDDYLRPMIENGSDELADGLVMRKKEALALIRGTLLENVRQVMKLTRTGVGGVGSLLQGATGSIGLLVQRQAGRIDFIARDTAGRKWNALLLVKTVVRDMAYQAWIDAQAEQIRIAGHDQAITSKGQVFDLTELESVRSEYFHPNSNNIMVPHVSS